MSSNELEVSYDGMFNPDYFMAMLLLLWLLCVDFHCLEAVVCCFLFVVSVCVC